MTALPLTHSHVFPLAFSNITALMFSCKGIAPVTWGRGFPRNGRISGGEWALGIGLALANQGPEVVQDLSDRFPVLNEAHDLESSLTV